MAAAASCKDGLVLGSSAAAAGDLVPKAKPGEEEPPCRAGDAGVDAGTRAEGETRLAVRSASWVSVETY